VLNAIAPEEFGNLLTHPERGTFPLSELLEMIAGHDRNHIVRLKELFGR